MELRKGVGIQRHRYFCIASEIWTLLKVVPHAAPLDAVTFGYLLKGQLVMPFPTSQVKHLVLFIFLWKRKIKH